MKQKTIVCIGDSNTWGSVPGGDGARLSLEQRWTSVMDGALNNGTGGFSREYCVIAEGLRGRTTVFDDPFSPGRSAATVIGMLLETHAPADLVVLMLGTNDTKNFYQASAEQIGKGIERLIRIVAAADSGPAGNSPPMLLVAPPLIKKLNAAMESSFAPGSRAKKISAELPGVFRTVGAQWGIDVFDGSAVAKTGSDGVHMDASGHHALGTAIAGVVIEVLSKHASGNADVSTG